jgi:chromosome segregation ATPase
MKKKDENIDIENVSELGNFSVGGVTKPIREHLRVTEEIIGKLRQDLDYYRQQNKSLQEEKNDLLKTVTTIGDFKDQNRSSLRDYNLVEEQRDRLANSLHVLQGEYKELITRCAQIENELSQEKKAHKHSKDIIVYLEAQVEQLEAMVALLREHRNFMEGDKE